MDPVTTLTFGSSSLVPCPNELSLDPLGRSSPRTRPGALTQSVLPGVSTIRLPSLLSNVLPGRFARTGPAKLRPSTVVTATTRPSRRRTGWRPIDDITLHSFQPGSTERLSLII